MRHLHWIETDDGKVAPVDDVLKWAEWMQARRLNDQIHVAQEYVGPYWVSTVFLGLDHGWTTGPLLYEVRDHDRRGGPEQADGYPLVGSSTALLHA